MKQRGQNEELPRLHIYRASKEYPEKFLKCFINETKSELNEHCLNGNLLTLVIPIAGKNFIGSGEPVALLDLNNKLEFT